MATININGVDCVFPCVPVGVLQSFGVTDRTHYLAYKLSAYPIHNAAISGLFSSAYLFGGLAAPAFFCQMDTDGRAIVLLENPSRTVIDHITDWIEWVMGADSFVYLYPFQKAVQELIRRAEEEDKDTDRAIDLMRYKNLYNRTIGAGNPHNLPETWTN